MSSVTVSPPQHGTLQRLRRWNATAVAGLVATITPMTAGVYGYFEKEREVTLQAHRLQQELDLDTVRSTNELRLGYLDRMREPAQQGRVLRMALISARAPEVRTWAEDELRRLEVETAAFEERYAKHIEEVAQAWQAALDAAEPRQRGAIRLEMARRRADLADRLLSQGHRLPNVPEGARDKHGL